MTKTEKLALNDYMEEPTKINLDLLLRTFNAPLDINPAAAKKILNLYIKTKDKARLKQFELLVSSNKKETKEETILTPTTPTTPTYKTEPEPENDEYKKLNDELLLLLKTNYSSTSHNPEIAARIKQIRTKIRELGIKLGIENVDVKASKVAVERYKKEIVEAIFGQIQNPNSLASQMYSGNLRTTAIRSTSHGANIECMNLNEMISRFEEVYGKPLPYNYFCEKVWNKGQTGYRLEITSTLNPTYVRTWQNGGTIETIG